jgi:hypothetical protein
VNGLSGALRGRGSLIVELGKGAVRGWKEMLLQSVQREDLKGGLNWRHCWEDQGSKNKTGFRGF